MSHRSAVILGSMLVAALTMLAARPLCAQAGGEIHEHAAPGTNLRFLTVESRLPPISLVRDDGRKVSLTGELNDGRPVVLNFIFTTCPGICPIMSHTFSVLQGRLRAKAMPVHLVSISIDPEQDTPERLREYAKKFSAAKHWQFYTGSVEASIAVQQAFGTYGGDKMRHDPVTFMRVAPGTPWERIDGFASAEQLLIEFTRLVSTPAIASR